MSNNLKNHPIRLKLIDSGANLSDHKPLTFVFSVINLTEPSEEVARADPNRLNPAAKHVAQTSCLRSILNMHTFLWYIVCVSYLS